LSEQVDRPDSDPGVEKARRRAISEDWAATIVGLVLLILVLAGVITRAMVP
jgi:hypothetical protein